MKLTTLRLKYRFQDLFRRWPLVRRTTMQRERNRARDEGMASVQDNLSKERKTVQAIIDRLHNVEFRFDGNTRSEYMVTVRFRPEAFTYGVAGTDEHRYIARHIGALVEREIATSKFIRDAHKHEQDEGPNFMGARISPLR